MCVCSGTVRAKCKNAAPLLPLPFYPRYISPPAALPFIPCADSRCMHIAQALAFRQAKATCRRQIVCGKRPDWHQLPFTVDSLSIFFRLVFGLSCGLWYPLNNLCECHLYVSIYCTIWARLTLAAEPDEPDEHSHSVWSHWNSTFEIKITGQARRYFLGHQIVSFLIERQNMRQPSNRTNIMHTDVRQMATRE